MCHFIGHNIVKIKQARSSNNYAIEQVRDNEVKEGTVFLAYEQTAGKGQLNNSWESEPGKNLTFSILLKPGFLEIRHQFMLSKIVCLGIESVLSDYVPGVKIKWPNDIYVADKKICGILIENSVMNGRILHSVVGIGINVNQDLFLSDAPNPVSLKNLVNQLFDLDDLLGTLLKSIDLYYQKLKRGEDHIINESFTSKLYQLNERKWYRDELHTYQGEIVGVNTIGQLIIQEPGSTVHAYHFKQVEYLTGNPNE